MTARDVIRIPSAALVRLLRLRAVLIAFCVTVGLVGATVRPAYAVSMHDLVALSKAGLGDEVLVALIEADGTVFNLDGPKILELRAQGLSERVITAMIRNGLRENTPSPLPEPVPPPPVPQPTAAAGTAQDPYFVVIGEKPPEPTPPPAPLYVVPWVPWVAPRIRGAHPAPFITYRGFGRFINDGWIDNTRRP
jgi:hypothetical protein